jgi:protein O-mannosyl-transferase
MGGGGRLDHMPAHEFVRRLRAQAAEPDRHYTLWLGAGCSVTSGIPAAGSLVRDQWLPRLHDLQGKRGSSIEDWARDTFAAYDPENLAALYGPVMGRLFKTKDDKQRETERLCEKGDPGFGYAVLAALMSRSDGIFSAALTTNFDDLIADSMYVFGDRRPLVIQHNALAGFVRPGRVLRPLVVKVHGDHRLNPMHTTEETEQLEAGMRNGVQGLLQDRGAIFVGYAGNDHGVVTSLEELPSSAVPLGVWWVSRREPTSAIRGWLEARHATWVEASGFDELMLLFREEFEIDHPTANKFERMVTRYRETYEDLSTRVADLPENAPDSGALKDAARSARESATEWWKVELEARQYVGDDPDRAAQIYEEGVRRIDDPRLVGNFANFLTDVRRDYDAAEKHYEWALREDPGNAINLSNYALFLSEVRKDYDGAEKHYKRAIEAEPQYGRALSNYAVFLTDVRRDFAAAEENHRRAIEVDPENARSLSNYAVFLSNVREDYTAAEEHFKRSLEVGFDAINLGSYALFLKKVRGDFDAAEEWYRKALEADPDNAVNLGNYAVFLRDIRKDYDAAQECYERALEADPNEANNLGNYSQFLLERDDSRGWGLLDRALSAATEAPLRLEVSFYELALGDEERAEGALPAIVELIGEGARSPGWNFDGILSRARREHRPEIEWLEKLADVISGDADPRQLDAWPRWRELDGS